MTSARAYWSLALAGAAILAITMGIRQSLGLFVSPLNTATGLGIVTVSFTLAVGQFVWGAAQPMFGAIVDRAGSARVMVFGAVLLAAGLVGTTLVDSSLGLVLFLGVVTSAGAGAGSFSIIMAAAANRLPPERRAMASGFINTGASVGQFVFAPLSQALIAAFGWVVALWSLAVAALATIPMAFVFRERPGEARSAPVAGLTLGRQVREAFRDPSYLCLHAGFFTCGFHIAFLVTHLPGEVALCGLPATVSAAALAIIGLGNIAGSLGAGWLGQSYRMKWILFGMYAARAVAILAYLAMPKTAATLYAFAAVLGFTWLATVPMTAGLVGKLFGVRFLATLFGLTLLSHQVGAFFGAWLGGLALDRTGSYDWMWVADAALAMAAALVNLPIREAPVAKPA
jgi:predicted MFS family arabinose efflux permease